MSPVALMTQVIPNRANRTLWWLIVLTLLAFSLLGPPAATLMYTRTWGSPALPTLLTLIVVNIVAAVTMAVILVPFMRSQRVISAARAIGYAIVASLVGTLVRIALPSVLEPENWSRNIAFVLLINLLFIGCIAAAVIYGSKLEDELRESFAAMARTQAALIHEEESVRAHVFDQLHGSLQAEFVAMRRILDDLAVRTPDPDAAATARSVEVRLEDVYRRGVDSVARALSPAGLDAGLVAAVRELEARMSGAVAVSVEVDPIVMVLDDPTTGGIRRDVRVAAYRVIEEAVSNASRHAGADEIAIRISSTLRSGQPQLLLLVSNPHTAPVQVTEGQGLTRMRSRVGALAGDLRIASTRSTFTVSARLPLQAPGLPDAMLD